MIGNFGRTPDVATKSSVIILMRVLSVLFGLTGLRSLVSAGRQVAPLFEGVFGPQTIRFGVLIGLTILFNLAFLNTAWLLFKSRTAGIRWGFVCLGLAASLWFTGDFGTADVIWVVGAAGALWWCSEQISNQPTPAK